jgi:glutamyl-Q tRNA(Asp) synthetase
MAVVTRFAPSPTGPLHLGHAWSALVAHDAARNAGGQFLLRIDDIDPGRVRAAFRDAIDVDLAWLGLVPDGDPLVQSQRFPAYRAALDRLAGDGLAYPCFCTRAEIAAEIAASAAAPHGPDGPAYPGTCRRLSAADAAARIGAGEAHAWRLDMTEALRRAGALVWHDHDGRAIAADPAAFGDIVLARRDAPASYHLASTLDDDAAGVTLAVRGEDLFAATHVHRLLQALLDLSSPAYLHHRLIGDVDGRRLAKRDDAASIASLRAAGTDPAILTTDLRAGRLPLGYRWVAP